MYPFRHLPRRLSQAVFTELRAALPPPLDDTPETLDNRDTIAMAAVAALGPNDIAEALLAAQVIAAEAHVRDAMRLCTVHRDDIRVVLRCRAQAASMARTMHRALGALHRLQAMRPPEGMTTSEPIAGREPDVSFAHPDPAPGAPAPEASIRSALPTPGEHSPDQDAAMTRPAGLAGQAPSRHGAGDRKHPGREKPGARTPGRDAPPAEVEAGESTDGWTGWREWPVARGSGYAAVPILPAQGDGQVA